MFTAFFFVAVGFFRLKRKKEYGNVWKNFRNGNTSIGVL
jgi:hypothetical protein